ncbi:MAG: TRAP transporter large permease subunit [Saprospiraceae bacterium]|nr:TRAP transporter large permease subunit [Saprospiraceae bacterium]
MEYWALLFFLLVFLLIMIGFPVAFTLGGLSVLFGLIFLDPSFFHFMPGRIMGVMNNYVLIAVPLFIFMGILLEQSGIAARLLNTMAAAIGKRRGGLAMSVVLVGTLLAASTGIVGATVVTMGLISLPVMLRSGYSARLATGTIAASGTLGQIIPPSIVLVLLGSVMNVPVGRLFAGALIPGLLLVVIYLGWLMLTARTQKVSTSLAASGPFTPTSDGRLWQTLVLPLLLMGAVLGSIFAGIASPTEAAAIGASGAMILTAGQRKLSLGLLRKTAMETMHLTAMVFMILLGASTFALVFRGMGGDVFLLEIITQSGLRQGQFLLLVMVLFFVVGFFIDFIEIIFILVPILMPLMAMYKLDMTWVAILIALNLQTSFLTPPFGFALFYLKGVAPPEVRTRDIYLGVIPFIILQLIVLTLVILFPEWLLSY